MLDALRPYLTLASAVALSVTLACRPEPPTPPPDPPVSETPAAPEYPQVDAAEMIASIEWLASDERKGRYTLTSEDIEPVAAWLAARYEELGLAPAPGAEGFRVPYELRTGAKAGDDQLLAIQTGNKRVEIGAEQFSPRMEGSSGEAEGELVFVGYAAHWQRPAPNKDDADQDGNDPPPKQPPIDSYDDLAGVDVKGKVALVLASAPNTPDFMEFFSAMQRLGEEFEVEAGPLREKDDLRKLERLHRKAREQLLDYASSFVDTKALPKDSPFWTVADPKATLDIMRLTGPLMALAEGRPQFDPMEHTLSRKVGKLAEAGAVGVVVVQGPRSFVGSEARKADALPAVDTGGGQLSPGKLRVLPNPEAIPVVQLRWKQADKLLKIDGKKLSQVQALIDADFQPRSQPLGVEVELHADIDDEMLEVPNVLASIPGKSDEVVLLGAHFDHIGDDVTGQCRAIIRREDRDTICNGADDNASGTAMLLELARVYSETGFEPERTIVFAHFSGEELGLLGSSAMAEQPTFDQARVSAMINLDMVGRLGPRGLAIGGIYTSDAWMPLLDELGSYGMDILYEGATTTRSDHAHWFRRKTPVLFFFTNTHGDYHRAGDEIDEINVEGMGTIGQLVSDLVWELGSGLEIGWTEPPEDGGIGRGLPGTNPDTIIKKNF